MQETVSTVLDRYCHAVQRGRCITSVLSSHQTRSHYTPASTLVQRLNAQGLKPVGYSLYLEPCCTGSQSHGHLAHSK